MNSGSGVVGTAKRSGFVSGSGSTDVTKSVGGFDEVSITDYVDPPKSFTEDMQASDSDVQQYDGYGDYDSSSTRRGVTYGGAQYDDRREDGGDVSKQDVVADELNSTYNPDIALNKSFELEKGKAMADSKTSFNSAMMQDGDRYHTSTGSVSNSQNRMRREVRDNQDPVYSDLSVGYVGENSVYSANRSMKRPRSNSSMHSNSQKYKEEFVTLPVQQYRNDSNASRSYSSDSYSDIYSGGVANDLDSESESFSNSRRDGGPIFDNMMKWTNNVLEANHDYQLSSMKNNSADDSFIATIKLMKDSGASMDQLNQFREAFAKNGFQMGTLSTDYNDYSTTALREGVNDVDSGISAIDHQHDDSGMSSVMPPDDRVDSIPTNGVSLNHVSVASGVTILNVGNSSSSLSDVNSDYLFVSDETNVPFLNDIVLNG